MEIEKLAKLARINLSSEEKKKLQKEFEAILNYISALKGIDTENLKLEEGFFQAGTLNAMRADEKTHETGEFAKELIEPAPFCENNFVKVKHVFE